MPIFSTPGNHEQEEGWNLDEAVGIGSIQARKAFFPTPSPLDGPFYSANSDPLSAIDEGTYGNEYREDYFAWTWGDALFMVIDTFEYTSQNPYGNVAGEGSNDPQTGDQWNWTLGQTQYNWLRDTLEASTAKYKFVFSHQMVGGMLHADVNVGYVRGGAEGAPYFEWGGYTSNTASAYDFATKRPGMTKTIRQLFIENGVSAYFHGHDHQYVYETRDNMAYVEVPSAGSMGRIQPLLCGQPHRCGRRLSDPGPVEFPGRPYSGHRGSEPGDPRAYLERGLRQRHAHHRALRHRSHPRSDHGGEPGRRRHHQSRGGHAQLRREHGRQHHRHSGRGLRVRLTGPGT